MSGQGILRKETCIDIQDASDEDFDPLKALPWFTLSSINFLAHLINADWKVFEFGTGNSSFFWVNRVAEYYAVEDNENWYDLVTSKIEKNASIKLIKKNSQFVDEELIKLDRKYPNQDDLADQLMNEKHGISNLNFQEYASQINNFPDKFFDVVIIDGKARKFSTFSSIRKVKEDGIIILDNSDRAQYRPIFDFLNNNGWYKIDFWGEGLINDYNWCTSLFIKDLNALKLKSNLLSEYECIFDS